MAINTSSLFHFTQKLDILFSILIHGFIPKYNDEDFSNLFSEPTKYWIPMVCFCDIPLTETKYHTKEYGSYGIGLSKEWGIKNSLNPIFYLSQYSIASNAYKQLIDSVSPHNESALDAHSIFLSYLKPYNGLSNKTNKQKDFSTEREWRWIATSSDLPIIGNLPTNISYASSFEEYKESKNNKLSNDVLQSKKHYLEFTSFDITYLIVETRSDKMILIEKILHSKEPIFFKQAQIDPKINLINKIISLDEIRTDF